MTRDEERLVALLHTAAPDNEGVAFEDVGRRVRRRAAAKWSVASSVVVVVVTVAAVAVGTAGGSPRPAVTTHPAPRPAPQTLVALTRAVKCPQPTTAARAQLATFHAVTAVSCNTDFRELPGAGQWQVFVRRVAVAGVAPLQAAFERPDDPPSTRGCTLDLQFVEPIIFVDAAGRTVAPTAPVDGCHKPQRQLDVALAGVTWHEVSVRRVHQMVSPQAEAAHCAMQWKNENWLAGQMHGTVSRGGQLFMRTPTTVHVCVFHIIGGDFEVGDFVRGLTLSSAQTRELLAALTGAGPTGACAGQRDFAVVQAGGQWANVELGGCWRVQRSDLDPGTGAADAAVVSRLLLHRG